MRILALNWRDLHHPEAGGAEVHLHEILSRLVRRGHEATLICSGFGGGTGEDRIDGVRVIRCGHWYDANFILPRFARRHMRGHSYDVVVEDINKVPFFMPLYTNLPVLPVIPHLFGTTVFREANPLIATYVVLMERLIPAVFRRSRFVVISPSTREDLLRRGILAERIEVVLCGLDHGRYRLLGLERFERPTIVHLGRLRRYKSVEVVMRALPLVRERIPGARLMIVGDGPHRAALERCAARLGPRDAFEFTGYLEGSRLVELLNRAHVAVNASPKEGWGLTVVEANACGVPVVASNRPGLRDSVVDGETGFLVPYGDAAAFADRCAALLGDGRLWERMSAEAVRRVAELTWERCALETEAILLRVAGGGA